MGWALALLAALVVVVTVAAIYICYLLDEMNRRLADLQVGIVKLRNGE